jgi:hypothetical protein
MTPAEIDRVFGLNRLQMATGPHVEVFREQARSGEERRYTKRFLATANIDFRAWTEREWRILERLGRHAGAPVAKALELLPADDRGPARLQTRDAGATVEQWATLVPLRRGDVPLRGAFEDCAHWWSLARHCVMALDALHSLGFVHLDLKADNICLPWAPAGAGRPVAGQPLVPRFKAVTLIDVAFSLLPEVDIVEPLPLLRQPAYEYQSPRLLHAIEESRRGLLGPTRALDWRCDFFSLAAMLWRYLPELGDATHSGWTPERHVQASEFVRQLLDVHGAAAPTYWPHRELIALTALRLRDPELTAALQAGCTFDGERSLPLGGPTTPPTRIAETPVRRSAARRDAASEGPASAPAPLAEVRREPAASAPAPAETRREPTASAPAPLAGTRHEPNAAAASADPATTQPMPDPADLAADAADEPASALPPLDGLIRPRRPHHVVVPLAFVAMLIGAAALAWWWTLAPGSFDPWSRADADRTRPELAAAPGASSPAAQALARTAGAASAAASTSGAGAPMPAPVADSEGLDAIAAELMRDRMPRVAEAAERQIARVLALAAESGEFRRRGAVRAAAQAMRAPAAAAAFATPLRADDARALNDAALVAYGRSDDVGEAIALQSKAFAANPLDAEVVGNLAFLRLKARPPQAVAARQLALHALTLNDPRFPGGRIEDWTTLAIASALVGRDADARNAWYVTIALASDLQRQCDAALRARASYGERVRASVQAMLLRARSSAAYGRCEVADEAPAREGAPAAKAAPTKSATATSRSGRRSRRAFP